MITRRSAIVGGLSATVVAAAGAAATARHGSLGAIRLVTSASAPAVRPAAAPAPTSPPARTRIEQPTTATVAADPVDSPLRVDWIGGSDVALEGVSLPDAFVRRVASVGGRPLAMRTRIRQGVMPIGVREMVEEAVAAGTEAIVMSLNLDWLYWDGVACDELTVPHERYECLLTPSSPAMNAQRAGELQALIDRAVDAGVPLYMYAQPLSSDVLADPTVIGRIEDAESKLAAYDPQRPNVRLVAETFTRMMSPLVEGIDFIDMVHPTATGAEALAGWLAADIGEFWASVGLGC